MAASFERYRREMAAFESDEPFFTGSGHASAIVPPIAGRRLRASVGSDLMAGYLLSSDAWQILIGRFLRPGCRVLDIGCGCGKLARVLAHNAHVVRYVGFDVSQENIDYCKDVLGPRLGDRFEFHRADLFSEAYNPTGALQASEFSFPAGDGTIDLAWACSLFTHLVEKDARRYLAEVRRVLTPSGLCLASIHTSPAAGTRYSGTEGRIDVDIEYFAELGAEAGLAVAAQLGEVCGQHVTVFKLGAEPAVTRRTAQAEAKLPARPSRVPPPPNQGRLSPEMVRLNDGAARPHDVPADIHGGDFIYWFAVNNPSLSQEGAIRYYFDDGARSAARVASELQALFGEREDPVELLEFASGYGCVSRHLAKQPGIDLVSSDIHPEAMQFIGGKLGVRTLLSHRIPENFRPDKPYDAIFALSFFSHMPRETFGRWLKALYAALKSPGYLLFTTQGMKAVESLQARTEDFSEDGFWFEPWSEQHDLDPDDYGVNITAPSFVVAEIHRATGAPLVAYKPAFWWSQQDFWILRRG